MKIITHSEKETAQTAADFAANLKPGDIILLYGTLGMGKSVFARGLIRALTNNPHLEVPSPTFTLLQTYDSPHGPIHHYDLYRIEDPEEILQLGWEDAITEGITIVEWPQRLGPYKPCNTLDITLSNVENDPHARSITINP
ncbi:MAG: tRNA (adenosine(37)-N6)-threonylcarbamoyltransferase complex ATPase subunit type 1 TsaE [Alphaproteobacteria bacterium]